MDAIDPFIQAPVPTIDMTMATSPNDAPQPCMPSIFSPKRRNDW